MEAKNQNNCFAPSGDNDSLGEKRKVTPEPVFYSEVKEVQPAETGTLSQIEEIICKFLSTFGYILISFLICILAVQLSTYIKPFQTDEDPVPQRWNITQITEELQKQVVGQQEAITKISGEISETYSRPGDKKWIKVIFLIGGPSVGKGLVIDIIHNHLQNNYLSAVTGDISNISSTSQNFCSQILKNSSPETDFMFLKNFNISESLLKSEDTKNEDEFSMLIKSLEKCVVLKKKNAILFVSSDVETDDKAAESTELLRREEYNIVLESTKQSLVKYTRKNSLEYKVTTIIFRLLSTPEVVRCLQMQDLNEYQLKTSEVAVSTWHNYRTGFVAQGCRPLGLNLPQTQSQEQHDLSQTLSQESPNLAITQNQEPLEPQE